MRHPLHPALVHFPVACWSIAVVADFASLRYGAAAWQLAAVMLIVGCALAAVAAVAGMLELARVPEGDALRDTWVHMGLMLGAFVLFAASLLARLDHSFHPGAPNTLMLVLDAAGFVALMIGGWYGGRLVYGHGIGRD